MIRNFSAKSLTRIITLKINEVCASMEYISMMYGKHLPERNDYLNLHSEIRWTTLSTKLNAGNIAFCDIMQKINRADCKGQLFENLNSN